MTLNISFSDLLNDGQRKSCFKSTKRFCKKVEFFSENGQVVHPVIFPPPFYDITSPMSVICDSTNGLFLY